MFSRLSACLALWFSCVSPQSAAQNLALPIHGNSSNSRIAIDTHYGRIVLELFADKAPATVNNFLACLQSGRYDNTIIHRVAKDFIGQGSAYDASLKIKPQRNAIVLEKIPGLKNHRGAIAAARKLSDTHSATSEFFIHLMDNPQLDFQSNTSPLNQGFAVFGQIIDGIEVIDKIRKVATTAKPDFPALPTTPVLIRSITRAAK